jgi:hypothetical protein
LKSGSKWHSTAMTIPREQSKNRAGAWPEKQCDRAHAIARTRPAVIRGAMMNARKLPLATLWRSDIAPRSLADRRLQGRVRHARCAGCPWRPLPPAEDSPLRDEPPRLNGPESGPEPARSRPDSHFCGRSVLLSNSSILGAREGITGKPVQVRRGPATVSRRIDLPSATRVNRGRRRV